MKLSEEIIKILSEDFNIGDKVKVFIYSNGNHKMYIGTIKSYDSGKFLYNVEVEGFNRLFSYPEHELIKA